MILCLDLETTGLDERVCGLVGIGAVWLHGGEFYRACRPFSSALIEPKALDVNGETMESLGAPGRIPESLAIAEFLGWARGGVPHGEKVHLAAWNAHFDHRHLRASLDRANVGSLFRPFTHRLIDLHSLLAGDDLRREYGDPRLVREDLQSAGGSIANADEGSRALGLEPEPMPHNALNGARQACAMLWRFIGNSGALP